MLYRFYPLFLIILLSTCLSGCGFHPLLTGDPSQAQRFTLQVNSPAYTGYKFRREFEKNLALTPKFNDKKYKVSVTVGDFPSNTLIAQDANILRAQVRMTAAYTVHLDGKQIHQGTVEASSAYSLLPAEEFATENARLAARERTMTVLAEELSLDVMRGIRGG